MTAQIETAKTEETATHATAKHISDAVRLFGETVKNTNDRILWLDSVLAYGVDVKTLAADLREANRTDPAIPVLSPAMLGYYRFPITVAETVGTTIRAWVKRNPEEVRTVYLAGKHAGLKRAGTTVREALKPIDAAKHREREEAASEAADALTAEVKPAPAAQGPRGKSGTETGTKSQQGRALAPAGEATAQDVLAAIRYATSAVNLGLSWSPDIASAVAELTDAVTARRKSDKATATAPTPGTVRAAVAA